MCVCVCVCNVFSCARVPKSNQQICILPEPVRSSKLLTQTDVEMNTSSFQMGHQFSTAALTPPSELWFLAQFLWCEMNVLGHWQVAMMPKSEGSEFDPCWVHNNFSVPLCVTCISPCQNIIIKPKNICMYMYMYIYIYIYTYIYI